MAGHAGLGGRDPCKATLFYRSVAVTAIDAELGNVMTVAEGHGLLPNNPDLGYVRRAFNCEESPGSTGNYEHAAEDSNL